MSPKLAYRGIWESLNGRGSWDLNPWLPIDENTPKDIDLLLFYPGLGKFTGIYKKPRWSRNYIFVPYAHINLSIDDRRHIKPTHYKELPEDPKE